jgi:hypothetical protein
MDAATRARLRAAISEYDSLCAGARALTATQARARTDLLAKLSKMTGAPSDQALSRAKRMLKKPTPTPKGGRKARYRGVSDLAPRTAMPRLLDATRVSQIVPSAIESDRRRH